MVETAKRLLTKEQMDEKSGKVTTSPFMKASQETDKITIGPEIGLIAESDTKIIIEEEETTTIEVVIETTDPIIGIIVGPEIETITEMAIGTIIDQIIKGMIVTRGMETEIRTTVGLEKEKGIEIGVVQEKVPNPEVAIGPKAEMIIGDRVEMIQETDLNQDPDQLPI